MTNIRPMTQAKYQLLVESRRTLSNAKWPIITVTCLALGLILGSLFVVLQLLKNIQFKSWYELSENATYTSKRAEFYAMASTHPGKGLSQMSIFSSEPKAQVHHPSRNFLRSNRSSPYPSMDNQHLVCYYAIHVEDPSKQMQPEDIDPFLCTHLIIAFGQIENCTLQPLLPEDMQIYDKVVALKQTNPALKVMLSVGQLTPEGGFFDLVQSESKRKSFARQAAAFLNELKIDGLDLDWEFPEWPPPGHKGVERAALSSLLYTLRRNFRGGRRRLLLSVAVGAPKAIADISYDVPFMAKYVDFVNLMTYDFHSYVWYLPVTGHNAPLYSNHYDKGLFTTLNTNWSANYWHDLGMPRRKIQIGIPTYAHTFRLVNPENNGLNAPAIGFGSIGVKGFAHYADICNFTSQPNTGVRWDNESKVPYAFNNYDWVSYDNVTSVEQKTTLVKSMNFGGAMVWSLSHDDFSGSCGQGKFPLVNRIKKALHIRHSDIML
ncbi:chitinase-3-like protein 2 [Neocloeon triangulifer]|uniref:chitinase-3-like protein 2 n=1 Tax=Neocloeon triangulifer TaxID=2078957 RepID=UPI00286F0A44|nr:chitinase-3-like protein 2 [Neocloeon triangulifer]